MTANSFVATASIGGLAFMAWLCPVTNAQARITEVVITATESPAFGGGSFGTVGPYERISGHLVGEVDPKDPRNGIIVDLGLAPRNARGMVSYSTEFQLLRPVARGKTSRLLFEITNRGRTNALELLNDAKTGNDVTTAGEPGNGFLMRAGYALLEIGADMTAPHNGKLFSAAAPIARHPDGSSITGLAVEEFVIDKNATPAQQRLTYPAASTDKSRASLTVRKNYADAPIPVPMEGWDYVDAKLNSVKLTSGSFGGPGSFGPTALYEFTYVAKDPIVVGLSFAAIRDAATFLRNAETDDKGTPNPLVGEAKSIYTFCSSQSCRIMHDFVQLGFNQPERAAAGAPKVFDGVLNWKAGGGGTFSNYRFSQPDRTHRQHIGRWTPEYQFPFADQMLSDPVTGKTDSRLRRCTESGSCPKIFEANSANEYWAKAASMMQTDSAGHDLGGVDGVRYYTFASFPHVVAGNGPGICAQPRSALRPSAVLRALLTDLDAWVAAGTPPPPDHLPRVADGTLVPPLSQAAVGFPRIPGVVFNGAHHTGDLFDFGPDFEKGFLSVLPPKLLGTPYPVFVPKTDADGNDIAGVRVPDVAVPVATYTGWALRADGLDGCDAAGQRIPFARTKAERVASGDPRLSLEERYPDHATYVSAVARAAAALEAERLLLDEDVAAYTAAAQAAQVP